MISILLDIACGYLIARNINRLWLAVVAAVAGGIVIAVGANMPVGSEVPDPVAADAIMKKVASGVLLNPLVILTALIVFRRNKEPSQKP
ncbi:hypothetical protein MMIC_P2313 [Mariprofundus micogutta]|uniref:Uncharacterized protein n=1 Tax=Mariprofundus micogutta TaxID=1921010 RepID=A0A1L8CR74_9PROT|nr:hypothetical protein [Mariprofundus micogutta]GAV21329.1 hypothetical protein MMIC_P2313 [Mariprofundus micogutta]